MVTKQEQLKWLANNLEKWKSGYDYAVVEKATDGYLYVRWPSVCASGITKKEWQLERDKMQKKVEQVVQPTQDNSWYERGELPPVGLPVELWVCGTFAYNCEFISKHGNNYVMWNLDRDRANSADYMHSQFRPLRTEREKAIEEMDAALRNRGSAISDAILGELYDAGFRISLDK